MSAFRGLLHGVEMLGPGLFSAVHARVVIRHIVLRRRPAYAAFSARPCSPSARPRRGIGKEGDSL